LLLRILTPVSPLRSPYEKEIAMSQPIKLSIIVIVYRMPHQAINTLYSLSTDYQRDVEGEDYEVVVVENSSDENINPDALANLNGNFRYFLRKETGVSPAPAINFALQQCQGELLGLIIDGARMLTPKVISHVLSVRKMFESPLVAVPGYHLGNQLHENLEADHAHNEHDLLANLNWKTDGYRLFDCACFSPGNKWGFFNPLMECNALFCTKNSFEEIGGADEQFSLPGGGSLNLHIYRKLGIRQEQKLVILPGEGNFHQYHGGVTTKAVTAREKLLQPFKDQLNQLWEGQYQALRREPLLFGTIGYNALRFLEFSVESGRKRFARFAVEKRDPWPDDHY
jgi:glycosyltransferase involved in cell wall biosynthesis